MTGDYILSMPDWRFDIQQSDFAHSCTRILRHMSIPTPEAQAKIADWRQKAREGSLTRDEMREAISFLRAERMAIPPSTAKPRAAAKAPVNADDLLGELGL